MQTPPIRPSAPGHLDEDLSCPTQTHRTPVGTPPQKPRFVQIIQEDRLLPLKSQPLIAGADPRNDVLLSDPTVSRRHCRIESRHGEWWVTDLDSKNGSYVNGLRVKTARVQSGDVVGLGRIMLRFVYSPPLRPSLRHPLRCGSMVSGDDKMGEIFNLIENLAKTELSVLISGPSGTGKELAAQALHQKGARRHAPFIPLNCGALPPDLLEAELFGYEKGAFTGADRAKAGVFEGAHTGVLFLDEIGELPLYQQPVLLRVLDSGQLRRLGSSVCRTVDVRMVAATNKNLPDLVAKGLFRQDLYFRLAEGLINLPALRQRSGDVALLLRHFTRTYPKTMGAPSPPGWALKLMERYTWPGNVRELRNVVLRATALGWPRALEPLQRRMAAPAANEAPTPRSVGVPARPQKHSHGATCTASRGPRSKTRPNPERAAACFPLPQYTAAGSHGVTAAEPSPLASAKAPFVQADPAPCNGPSEKTEKDPFAPGFTPPPAKRSALLFAGRTLQEIEKSMISQALRKSGGNKSAAAKLLGMRRSTFRSKLRRHGMG